MSPSKRRVFLLQLAACGSALTGAQVQAQPAMVDEKDPQALALGYVADSARANVRKFPKHKKEQRCANCVRFQGKAGDDAVGGCPLFGAKQVAASGWCSAWAKQA